MKIVTRVERCYSLRPPHVRVVIHYADGTKDRLNFHKDQLQEAEEIAWRAIVEAEAVAIQSRSISPINL